MHNNLILLERMHINDAVIPTRFDYYYAINTEILELAVQYELGRGSREEFELELVDIAIFCYLYLNIHHKGAFSKINMVSEIQKFVKDDFDRLADFSFIYSYNLDVKSTAVRLLIYGLTSPKFSEKLKYNDRRLDHDKAKQN